MMFKETTVETCDFYCGQQEPRRFLYEDRWLDIAKVEDRWYEGYMQAARVPQRYFKIRTAEGECYMLRYNELFCRWSVRKLNF